MQLSHLSGLEHVRDPTIWSQKNLQLSIDDKSDLVEKVPQECCKTSFNYHAKFCVAPTFAQSHWELLKWSVSQAGREPIFKKSQRAGPCLWAWTVVRTSHHANWCAQKNECRMILKKIPQAICFMPHYSICPRQLWLFGHVSMLALQRQDERGRLVAELEVNVSLACHTKAEWNVLGSYLHT